MPTGVAGPIIGGAAGLIVIGVLFLMFALAVFYSTPAQCTRAVQKLIEK